MSVLIAAVIAKHDSHAKAFPILERVQNGKDEGFVAAHSLAEVYAILTKPFPASCCILLRLVGACGDTFRVLLLSNEHSHGETTPPGDACDLEPS